MFVTGKRKQCRLLQPPSQQQGKSSKHQNVGAGSWRHQRQVNCVKHLFPKPSKNQEVFAIDFQQIWLPSSNTTGQNLFVMANFFPRETVQNCPAQTRFQSTWQVCPKMSSSCPEIPALTNLLFLTFITECPTSFLPGSLWCFSCLRSESGSACLALWLTSSSTSAFYLQLLVSPVLWPLTFALSACVPVSDISFSLY